MTGSVIYTFFNTDRPDFQSFYAKCFAICLFFYAVPLSNDPGF